MYSERLLFPEDIVEVSDMVFVDQLRGRRTLKDIYRPPKWGEPNPFIDTDEDDWFSRLVPSSHYSTSAKLDRLTKQSGITSLSKLFGLPTKNLKTEQPVKGTDQGPDELIDKLPKEDNGSWTSLEINRLSSPTAREILSGYCDVLVKWVDKYGDDADQSFIKDPMSIKDLPHPYQELLNGIYYQLGLEPDFSELPSQLAGRIGEYTANQLINAIPFAHVSGEVVSQYQLDYRLRLGFSYLNSFDFEQKTTRFTAFGTYWYPVWQFDFVRGYTWDQMNELMIACKKRGFSNMEIMDWATTTNPKLNDNTPAQWIRGGRSLEKAISTISNFQANLTPMSRIPFVIQERSSDIIESTDQSPNDDSELQGLSVPLARIANNKIALSHISGFMKHLSSLDERKLESYTDPRGYGAKVAQKAMSSYFQSQSFTYNALDQWKNAINELPDLDSQAIDWLGIQTARYLYDLTNKMAVIGPALAEGEIAGILNGSQPEDISRLLSDLKERNQLISISIMDEELYPSWQFDAKRHQVRPTVRMLLPTLQSRNIFVKPYATMAWANDPETEHLYGNTPADWIKKMEESDESMYEEKAALDKAAKALVQRYIF